MSATVFQVIRKVEVKVSLVFDQNGDFTASLVVSFSCIELLLDGVLGLRGAKGCSKQIGALLGQYV